MALTDMELDDGRGAQTHAAAIPDAYLQDPERLFL
jgi:hypothetical protein